MNEDVNILYAPRPGVQVLNRGAAEMIKRIWDSVMWKQEQVHISMDVQNINEVVSVLHDPDAALTNSTPVRTVRVFREEA